MTHSPMPHRRPARIAWLVVLGVAGLGASAIAQSRSPPIPPPQQSLDIPPLIDPARTAVLSGMVPLKSQKQREGSSPPPSKGAAADRAPENRGPPLLPVVWIVPSAGTTIPRLPDQPVIVGDDGFYPTTILTTPATIVGFRSRESGVRVVVGRGALRFERRLTRDTRALPVVPERPGATELSVREAPDVKGVIVCVNSAYATVADSIGSFRIVGVPPGRWQVKVRLPDGTELERTVDLRAGREHTVDWRDAKE